MISEWILGTSKSLRKRHRKIGKSALYKSVAFYPIFHPSRNAAWNLRRKQLPENGKSENLDSFPITGIS
jgi:hypothetical protein